MNWLRELISDLATPSGNESNYQWALVAIGHTVIGAALFALFGWWGLAVYAFKEASDLRRGGRWGDSAVDMAFVAIGGVYGPAWWPFLVFLAVGVGLAVRNVTTN